MVETGAMIYAQKMENFLHRFFGVDGRKEWRMKEERITGEEREKFAVFVSHAPIIILVADKLHVCWRRVRTFIRFNFQVPTRPTRPTTTGARESV